MSSSVVVNLISPVDVAVNSYRGFSLPALALLADIPSYHLTYFDGATQEDRILTSDKVSFHLRFINSRFHATLIMLGSSDDANSLLYSTAFKDEKAYYNGDDDSVSEPEGVPFTEEDFYRAAFYQSSSFNLTVPEFPRSVAEKFSSEYEALLSKAERRGMKFTEEELRELFRTLHPQGYERYYLGSDEDWEEYGHVVELTPFPLIIQSIVLTNPVFTGVMDTITYPVLSNEPQFD
jgi:hypothetical protein